MSGTGTVGAPTAPARTAVVPPARAATTWTKRTRAPLSVGIAVTWLSIVVLAALLADLLPLVDYRIRVDGLASRQPPRLSFHEPLGTDTIGRSMLSRVVYGARQSLMVGILVVLGGTVIGGMLGLLAAYFRGIVDKIISIVLDSALAIPPLILLLAMAAIGQRSIVTVIAGLVIVTVPGFARIARANALSQVQRPYVLAARALGARTSRIVVREIVPNVALPVLTYAFLVVGIVIVAEGSMSFLGLGVPPPQPSWGGMVNDGRNDLESSPHLVFVPATCLILTVYSITVVGRHLRRRVDTRASQR